MNLDYAHRTLQQSMHVRLPLLSSLLYVPKAFLRIGNTSDDTCQTHFYNARSEHDDFYLDVSWNMFVTVRV